MKDIHPKGAGSARDRLSNRTVPDEPERLALQERPIPNSWLKALPGASAYIPIRGGYAPSKGEHHSERKFSSRLNKC